MSKFFKDLKKGLEEVIAHEQVRTILKNHKHELVKLGVKALSIFGSFARGMETKKSDVDVLIDFDSRKGLFGLANIQIFLEKILGRKVDIVTKRTLHPALKKKVLKESVRIF